MSDKPRDCIVCHKKVDQVEPTHTPTLPYEATLFTTHGHYGSTAYDPVGLTGGNYLEVTICDPCLIRAAGQGLVWECTSTMPRAVVDYAVWEPFDG